MARERQLTRQEIVEMFPEDPDTIAALQSFAIWFLNRGKSASSREALGEELEKVLEQLERVTIEVEIDSEDALV